MVSVDGYASFRESFPRYPWSGEVNLQQLEAEQDEYVSATKKQTIIKNDIKIIKRDQGEIAYLLANGFKCKFVTRHDNIGIDAEFIWTKKLERCALNYAANVGVPVLSFLAALDQVVKENGKVLLKRYGGGK